MIKCINTPLGKVRVPEPLEHVVEVNHDLVYPLMDRIKVQLLGTADDGLVVVASATFRRAVAARLLQALAAGLDDHGPGTNDDSRLTCPSR
jgi:hypothetical protein